jgi:hypothetical protein
METEIEGRGKRLPLDQKRKREKGDVVETVGLIPLYFLFSNIIFICSNIILYL